MLEKIRIDHNAIKKMINVLNIRCRSEFRDWLKNNSETEKECWIAVKRGRIQPDNALWYLDAVEEAFCFGWIDSTLKNVDGIALQRFGPRAKSGRWTELNKERCRRLEKLGLMTERGRLVCPDLDAEFVIIPEIIKAFEANPVAWHNFRSFPPLYQRVRIDNIQRNKACKELFESRLRKLIEASERGEMIGDWHDYGRLLDY
ncbi:MAG: YdeI/OmpD-associated family protein [Muribaculaceae bacterium]|nr:YdeI/OmpD-associated family protein [Muribaculaceae bacterium]